MEAEIYTSLSDRAEVSAKDELRIYGCCFLSRITFHPAVHFIGLQFRHFGLVYDFREMERTVRIILVHCTGHMGGKTYQGSPPEMS
jgi:hypothetical protein